ncbi:MAG: hypothetical protein HC811_13955 [Flammeovirgaceae bacterium]|nr:hypothetical protein [Flammeovirgaceae bacterium]
MCSLLMISISFLCCAKAVDQPFTDRDNIQRIAKGTNGFLDSFSPISKDEGSPYLFDWTNGVVFRDSSVILSCYTMYDASKDRFIMKTSSLMFELDGTKVDSIVAEDKRFCFFAFRFL